MKAALYVRVSTQDQDLEHQEHELRQDLARRGYELAGIYSEKVSGVAKKRPELERLRHDAALNRFKVVFVWSLDRLGRSLIEIVNVVRELHDRGVGVVSLRQGAFDLTSPMSKYLLAGLAAAAELERDLISERTRSGMAGARRRGAKIGRPKKILDPAQIAHLVELQPPSTKHSRAGRVARQLGVSKRTIHRALAAYKARQCQNGGAGDESAGPLFSRG